MNKEKKTSFYIRVIKSFYKQEKGEMKRVKFFIFVILFSTFNLYGYERLIDSRPVGMGESGRASAGSNSSLYLNPAGLSLARIYHVEFLYLIEPQLNSHMGAISIVDSVTNPVAAGLHFSYYKIDPNGINREDYDVRLGLAYNLGSILLLGLTIKYLYTDTNGRGPLGKPLLDSSGDPLLNTVTLDAGLIVNIKNRIFLGVVGYNLTVTKSLYAPLQLGLGTTLVIIQNLLISGDMVIDFSSREDTKIMNYMGGIELFLFNHFPLRGGYKYDGLKESHLVTAGTGYIHKQFSVELSFEQDVTHDKNTIITIGIKYFAN